MRGRWWKRSEKHRADKRQVDARALGGRGIAYRFATPEGARKDSRGSPEDPLDVEKRAPN